jgi:hypothetical protein
MEERSSRDGRAHRNKKSENEGPNVRGRLDSQSIKPRLVYMQITCNLKWPSKNYESKGNTTSKLGRQSTGVEGSERCR